MTQLSRLRQTLPAITSILPVLSELFFDRESKQIIEREVESVVRESHVYHFEWLERKLSIPLRKELTSWPNFVEICERRNLLTHTGGRVTSQYLEVCDRHGVDLSGIKRGAELGVYLPYFTKALDVFLEIGIKLGHIIWRKSVDDPEAPDNSLISLTYQLIRDKKYEVSKRILDFAVKMPSLANEEVRRILIVNRANSYKLDGDKDRAKEILSAEDWSATSEKFRISVAAVLDEDDIVIALMRTIGANGSVQRSDYLEWPVFESIRKTEEFRAAFHEVFGVSAVAEESMTLLQRVASEA